MGKGDTYRPCDLSRYRANYDRIFGSAPDVKIGKPFSGVKQGKSPKSRVLTNMTKKEMLR